MKSLLGMLPGIGNQLKGLDLDDSQIDRTEAIIKSMTADERKDVDLLNNSRRRRISKGSGTSQQDVSQLVKGFGMVSQMSKQMSGMGMVSRMKALSGLGGADLAAMSGGAMPKVKSSTKSNKKRGMFKSRKRKRR